MNVSCLNCGIEFEKSVSAVNKSPNHFCSRSCSVTFNNRKAPKRRPEGHCRVCQTPTPTHQRWCSDACRDQERAAKLQKRLKRKAVDLMGGKCQVCGYSRSIRALGFHHLDPSKKDFNISTNNTKSWARVQEELKKCVLLCANCHGEVHDGLLDVANLARAEGFEPPTSTLTACRSTAELCPRTLN